MSSEAWFGLLNLAEEYGWNAMGTRLPERTLDREMEPAWPGSGDPEQWRGNYRASEGGLVLFDDALNLADALERCFLDYEAESPRDAARLAAFGLPALTARPNPGIGAITALVDFCRQGAFWIE